jgi:predicted transcriptional regulator
MALTKKQMALTKKQMALIDEGVQCSKDMKAAETRLDEIKEFLADLEKGTHVTKNNGVLIISEKDLYDAPSAEKLLAELKKTNQQSLFPKCVNVIKKSCDAILGAGIFDKLRTFKKTSKAFSFK